MVLKAAQFRVEIWLSSISQSWTNFGKIGFKFRKGAKGSDPSNSPFPWTKKINIAIPLPLLLSVSLISLIYLGYGPEKKGGSQSVEEIFESGLVWKFDRGYEKDGG